MASRLRILLIGIAALVLSGAPLAAVAPVSRHECGPNQDGLAEVQAPAALAEHAMHSTAALHAIHAAPAPAEAAAILADEQQCSHCPHPQCATSQHCAAPAAVALSSRGAVLVAPATAIPSGAWVPDCPLSVNLAPPIPPPQTLL